MIKETIYTYEYSQPKEYRFSLDSVYLAKIVALSLKKTSQTSEALRKMRVLDLCAGCGVIGLELNYHQPDLEQIDFIDVQDVYQSHFLKNVEQVKNVKENFRYLVKNYSDCLRDQNFENQYDIIVCNPPYFFKEEGLLSPSDFKNRCRFFLDSDYQTLIESILFFLKKNAHAYLLMRPGGHHGRNLMNELKLQLNQRADAQFFDEVRGTHVIRIAKKG